MQAQEGIAGLSQCRAELSAPQGHAEAISTSASLPFWRLAAACRDFCTRKGLRRPKGRRAARGDLFAAAGALPVSERVNALVKLIIDTKFSVNRIWRGTSRCAIHYVANSSARLRSTQAKPIGGGVTPGIKTDEAVGRPQVIRTASSKSTKHRWQRSQALRRPERQPIRPAYRPCTAENSVSVLEKFASSRGDSATSRTITTRWRCGMKQARNETAQSVRETAFPRTVSDFVLSGPHFYRRRPSQQDSAIGLHS